MLLQDLSDWAKQKGYRIGFAEIGLLDSIKRRLKTFMAKGEIDPGFAENNFNVFKYLEGSLLQNPRTILMVAVPLPAWVLKFDFKGGSVETILPPTYVEYRVLFERVRVEIQNEVLGGNPGIETLEAPLKSLAACAGMVSYGRNNITYIPEFGSYFQLAGYLLDVDVPGAANMARVERRLEACSKCRACVKACSLGAITEDRFLIHAERCYTLYSESLEPIPEGIRPPSPDCLIGCLKCQKVCPANKGLLRYEKARVSFTSEETAALVGEPTVQDLQLNKTINSKFSALAFTDGLPVFRRNLRLLLENRSPAKTSPSIRIFNKFVDDNS